MNQAEDPGAFTKQVRGVAPSVCLLGLTSILRILQIAEIPREHQTLETVRNGDGVSGWGSRWEVVWGGLCRSTVGRARAPLLESLGWRGRYRWGGGSSWRQLRPALYLGRVGGCRLGDFTGSGSPFQAPKYLLHLLPGASRLSENSFPFTSEGESEAPRGVRAEVDPISFPSRSRCSEMCRPDCAGLTDRRPGPLGLLGKQRGAKGS